MKMELVNDSTVSIKVIGVGGGGNNAVNTMIKKGVKGVEFIAVNTDIQAINYSSAETKIQIGEKLTKGLGAGANPDIGRQAAEESIEEITKALEGTKMLFITAGMGGGTGTGAAPVIAEIAKSMKILTIGVVTKPFFFEARSRTRQAEEGIKKLQENIDSLIVIPNEKLHNFSEEKLTLTNAFEIADSVLIQAVENISQVVDEKGIINLDFADVKSIMENAGYAYMGVGKASGKNKMAEVAERAILSPLLETSIIGAKKLILYIRGSEDVGFEEVTGAAQIIQEHVHEDVELIFGACTDPALVDEMQLTIIATCLQEKPKTTEIVEAKIEQVEPVEKAEPVQIPVSKGSMEGDSFDDILSIFDKK